MADVNESRLNQLVEEMLILHRQRQTARTPHEQTAIERQITSTDRLIDRKVYALYLMTDEEIEVVEGL